MNNKFDNVLKNFLKENNANLTQLANVLKSTGQQGVAGAATGAEQIMQAAGVANPQQAQKDPKQVAQSFADVLDDNKQNYNWKEFSADHPEVVKKLVERGAPLTVDTASTQPKSTTTSPAGSQNAYNGGSKPATT
jgi:hypothetical protein